MKVFEGQSAVGPGRPGYWSAVIAAPIQPPKATAGRPFQAPQASSNRRVRSPSDQRPESTMPSHSSCRRARSRPSDPNAKDEKAGAGGTAGGGGRRGAGGGGGPPGQK